MIEYLSFDETRFLAGLVNGEYAADFWNDNARRELVAKLTRAGQWALREDAARAKLRNG